MDPVKLKNNINNISSKKLTTYMVPKFIIEIDEIPKTANGKLDKLSLTNRPLPVEVKPLASSAATTTVSNNAPVWKSIRYK